MAQHSGGSRWVDVGCGTGAVTDAILPQGEPIAVVGFDPSQACVAHARAHIVDPRARFDLGSATALPLDDGAVDAAVCGLVLNFVPDADRAVAEMARVTRTGGAVGAYVRRVLQFDPFDRPTNPLPTLSRRPAGQSSPAESERALPCSVVQNN